MGAIYKLNKGVISGAKKWGNNTLNFFVHHRTEIGVTYFDEDEQIEKTVSVVVFRFHSSKAFCEWDKGKHIKEHGGIHVRAFTYEGTDKNEDELLEWALTTPDLVANDGITTIYKAKEV